MKMKGKEDTEGTVATFISRKESNFDRKCLHAITLYWTMSSLRALVNPVFLKCPSLGS